MSNLEWTPVTVEHCGHVKGPFYHGTKSVPKLGAKLVPGFGSNFQEGRVSNYIYFTALVDTAAWGAELATALVAKTRRFTEPARAATMVALTPASTSGYG